MRKKCCNICGEHNEISEFFKDKTKKFGVSGTCKIYDKKRSLAWSAANREKSNAIKKKYVENNHEKRKESAVKWASRNRPKYSELPKKYMAVRRANTVMYFTRRDRACPPWIGEEERWMMKEAYELAKLREATVGGKWNVDHIVPLQGKIVSGLHVPWNLQVIPAITNRKKGNKHHA